MLLRPSLCAALCLAASSVMANSSIYITDSVSVAVFADQSLVGEPTQRLLSGTPIEVLQSSDGKVQIKTASGTVGWVRSSFVTSQVPAVHRLDQAQQQLDKLQQEIIESQKTVAKLEKDNAELKKLNWVRGELKKARARISELESTQSGSQETLGQQESELTEMQQQVADLSVQNEDLLQRLAASELIMSDPMAQQNQEPESVTIPGVLWLVVGIALGAVPGFKLGFRHLEHKLQTRFGGIKLY